jgi:hypothetical protein
MRKFSARAAAWMSVALGAGWHGRKLEGSRRQKPSNKIRNCFFSLRGPFMQIQLCPKKHIVTFGQQDVARAEAARSD